MGGGGAMRAVAKVAGFSVKGALRGAQAVPVAEQSVTTAARKASTPGIVSSVHTEEGKSSVLLSSQTAKIDAVSAVQRPVWEIDDWEFAGDEGELVSDSMDAMPRVVFGGVPTLEEAKEATSDLKDALDKVYFSSSNSSGYSETKACVTSETVVTRPSAPKNAVQAFLLLKESPEAQGVVASLASDKNVWDAVMQNAKVMEFIQSQKTSALPSDMDMNKKELFADDGFLDQKSSNIDVGVDDKDSESSGNGFMGFIQNIKLKVTEMVRNVSDFFQTLFGDTVAGNVSVDDNGNATATNADRTIGASFMALAVLVIMVVVLKRG